METPTVKVKSTDPKSQGPYVLVDKAKYDADPSAYELFDDTPAPAAKMTAAQKKAAEKAEAEAKAAAEAEAKAKAAAEAEAKAKAEAEAEAAAKAGNGWNT